MKKIVALLPLTASMLFAQAVKPAPQCATLLKCRALIKAQADEKAQLQLQLDAKTKENADLQARSADTAKQYADAIAVLDTLATQIKGQRLNMEQQKALDAIKPGKALELGISLEKDTDIIFKYATKLQQDLKAKSDAYDALVDKYNSTLQQANNIINVQNERLARQQRISNALAVLSMMPKSQPYYLPPPPVFQSNTINCISNSTGNTIYTNCH